MKLHKKIIPWLGVGGVILAALFFLWPLLRHGFFITDDGDWMIIRLSSFYQSLVGGQFPVRFLGRLNHNYGYPVANFLYPGFLYVGSLIRLLGFSYVDVIKIIILFSVVGSGIFLYFALYKKYESLSSLGGAISFVLSPYLVFDLYKRGSVGELFAFLPASILLFGVIGNILWIIPFATAVLIVSHNSFALMFVGVAIAYMSFQTKVWEYIKGMLIGVGMATFFWLPALYERRYIIFDSVSVSDPYSYFVTYGNWPLLGVGLLAAMFVFISRAKKIALFEKVSAGITLFAVFLSLSISAFIWKSLPLLTSFIQFPFRFLSVASMIGAFSIAVFLSSLKKTSRVIAFSFLVVVLIYSTAQQQRFISYTDHVEGYYSTNEGTTTVRNEFMPRWVQVVPLKRANQKITVLSGDATFYSGKETPQRLDGILDVKQPSLIQINTIYYPGWGVTLNGILTPVDYINQYGLMQFGVEKGRYRLEVSFRETGFRLITDIISFAFGGIYILWMIKTLRRA